jgi:hypothetical protein
LFSQQALVGWKISMNWIVPSKLWHIIVVIRVWTILLNWIMETGGTTLSISRQEGIWVKA